jgi:ribose transport system permease protein
MIIILSVIMVWAAPGFFNVGNLRAIALDASIIMLLGVGMTTVITVRGIDLSIGAVLILSSVVLAAAIKDFAIPVPLAIFLCLLTGSACGLVNGILVTKLRMPDFIVTLSTELVFRGLALIYAGGAVFFGFPETIKFFGRGRIFNIPMPIIISILIVFLGHLIFAFHQLGYRLHAVGGNPTAARRFGVNVDLYRIGAYVGMGFLAALGGLVLTGRLDAVVATGAVSNPPSKYYCGSYCRWHPLVRRTGFHYWHIPRKHTFGNDSKCSCVARFRSILAARCCWRGYFDHYRTLLTKRREGRGIKAVS